MFYKDPSRFAYSFQHYVLMSRMKKDRSTRDAEGKGLRVLERSIFSDRQVSAAVLLLCYCPCPRRRAATCSAITARLASGARRCRRPTPARARSRCSTPPQVFVRAMHDEGAMEDFEVQVYNDM